MMKRYLLMSLLLAFAFPARAEENIELKFSSWVPPAHALHTAIKRWGDSMTAASKGSLKVTLYPAEQLGKANDHLDMARDGIAEVTYISLGYQAGRLPVAEAANLPFLVSNADGGSKALDEWYRPYAASEMKEVKYCLGFFHDPGTFHSKKELRTPDAIKGLKVRSAHSTMANFITALGGVNVRVSAPEARSALESGVADVITFPWQSILLFGIDKVVTHSADVNFYASGFAWVMNKGVYERMSDAQKKIVDDHCSTEWAGTVGKIWGDYEAAGRANLKAKAGHTVYALKPEEIEAWRKAAEPVRQQWTDNVKKSNLADPAKTLAELEATIAKHGAAFK
jgi:TRAP-type C4-dicarboxylate transport system substrate-binding protein